MQSFMCRMGELSRTSTRWIAFHTGKTGDFCSSFEKVQIAVQILSLGTQPQWVATSCRFSLSNFVRFWTAIVRRRVYGRCIRLVYLVTMLGYRFQARLHISLPLVLFQNFTKDGFSSTNSISERRFYVPRFSCRVSSCCFVLQYCLTISFLDWEDLLAKKRIVALVRLPFSKGPNHIDCTATNFAAFIHLRWYYRTKIDWII